jgi:hypothetical protein
LLYDWGAGIEIGDPRARTRKELFTDRILRAVIETVESIEEKQQLLDEIEACACAHLNALEHSWSVPGLWHLFIIRFASRRIDRLLAGLRTRVGISGDQHAPSSF